MISSVLVKSDLERVDVSVERAPRAALGPQRGARGPRLAAATSCGLDRADDGTVGNDARVSRRRDFRAACPAIQPSALAGSAWRSCPSRWRLSDMACASRTRSLALRLRWAILIPVLALFTKRALAADLDSLRRAIDEGYDLTESATQPSVPRQ
jgi:hypothetical protein